MFSASLSAGIFQELAFADQSESDVNDATTNEMMDVAATEETTTEATATKAPVHVPVPATEVMVAVTPVSATAATTMPEAAAVPEVSAVPATETMDVDVVATKPAAPSVMYYSFAAPPPPVAAVNSESGSHWGDITAQSTDEMHCMIRNGPCPNDRPATFVKQGKWFTWEEDVVPPAAAVINVTASPTDAVEEEEDEEDESITEWLASNKAAENKTS
jgi:hypothetical protein